MKEYHTELRLRFVFSLAVASFSLFAAPQLAAQARSVTMLDFTTGSEYEDYLRVLQISGKVPLQPWSIRGFSRREIERLALADSTGPWKLRGRFSSSHLSDGASQARRHVQLCLSIRCERRAAVGGSRTDRRGQWRSKRLRRAVVLRDRSDGVQRRESSVRADAEWLRRAAGIQSRDIRRQCRFAATIRRRGVFTLRSGEFVRPAGFPIHFARRFDRERMDWTRHRVSVSPEQQRARLSASFSCHGRSVEYLDRASASPGFLGKIGSIGLFPGNRLGSFSICRPNRNSPPGNIAAGALSAPGIPGLELGVGRFFPCAVRRRRAKLLISGESRWPCFS